MKYLILLLVAVPVLASSYMHSLCSDAYVDGKATNNITIKEGQVNNYIFGKDRSDGYFFDIVQNDQLVERMQTQFLPLDTIEDNGYIYTLYSNQIIVKDANNLNVVMKMKTTKNPITNKHQAASEIHIEGNNIYIAHGSLHLVIMDKKSGLTINQVKYDIQKKKSHISRLTGLEVHNNKIYMMYDNVTYDFGDQTRAFEGMLIVDKTSLKPIKQIWIKQSQEALHEPTLNRDGNTLYSQNLHLIFNYNIDKLERLRTLRPNRRLYNFDNLKLIGKPIVKDRKISGCFKKRASQNGDISSTYYQYTY